MIRHALILTTLLSLLLPALTLAQVPPASGAAHYNAILAALDGAKAYCGDGPSMDEGQLASAVEIQLGDGFREEIFFNALSRALKEGEVLSGPEGYCILTSVPEDG